MSIAPNQSESTTAELRAALPTTGWRQPAVMLMIMAAAMQLSFASWSALQYNFAHEMLDFTGREIGIQQSIREIPGFLSFAAVFFLFAMREQTFALISLVLLGGGVVRPGISRQRWAFISRHSSARSGFIITRPCISRSLCNGCRKIKHPRSWDAF